MPVLLAQVILHILAAKAGVSSCVLFLKLYFATLSSDWGGRRKLLYLFAKYGAIMAASA